MSASNQGSQSPPLEQQEGKQGDSPPATGQGISTVRDSKEKSKQTLKGLESNPVGAMDKHAHEATKKPTDTS